MVAGKKTKNKKQKTYWKKETNYTSFLFVFKFLIGLTVWKNTELLSYMLFHWSQKCIRQRTGQ